MTDGEPLLVCSDLRKRYGERVAVDGVSFHIAPGETYGLLGPNGAGKTTTISMVCGLMERDGGEVRVAGTADGRQRRRRQGRHRLRAPGPGHLPRPLGAREPALLRPAAEAARRGARRARRRGPRAGRPGRPRRRPHRRLLGRHEASPQHRHRPAPRATLLVLDEPTVGVDPQSRNAILEAVDELGKGGMAILYTTHYMEEAERLCDRIGIIDEGGILAEGTRRELVAIVGQKDRVSLAANGDVHAAARGARGARSDRRGQHLDDGGIEIVADDARTLLPQIIHGRDRGGRHHQQRRGRRARPGGRLPAPHRQGPAGLGKPTTRCAPRSTSRSRTSSSASATVPRCSSPSWRRSSWRCSSRSCSAASTRASTPTGPSSTSMAARSRWPSSTGPSRAWRRPGSSASTSLADADAARAAVDDGSVQHRHHHPGGLLRIGGAWRRWQHRAHHQSRRDHLRAGRALGPLRLHQPGRRGRHLGRYGPLRGRRAPRRRAHRRALAELAAGAARPHRPRRRRGARTAPPRPRPTTPRPWPSCSSSWAPSSASPACSPRSAPRPSRAWSPRRSSRSPSCSARSIVSMVLAIVSMSVIVLGHGAAAGGALGRPHRHRCSHPRGRARGHRHRPARGRLRQDRGPGRLAGGHRDHLAGGPGRLVLPGRPGCPG